MADSTDTLTACTTSTSCDSDECCGILTASGSSTALTTSYCLPSTDGNGLTPFTIGTTSYTGVCSSPSDFTCVADDPDSDSEDSECAPFDTTSTTYCCAVKTTSSKGTYDAGTTGTCQSETTTNDNSGNADTNGEYTVCSAIALASTIAFASILF